MIINREESLNFKSYVDKIKLNLKSIGSGVYISTTLEDRYKKILRDKKRAEIEGRKIEYAKRLDNADMSLFDENFVELYRNGVLNIKKTLKDYPIKDLYIEQGMQNGKKIVHLISIMNDDDIDILTEDDMNGFERKEFMPFRYSQSFYEIYEVCKNKSLIDGLELLVTDDIYDDICNIISNFNNLKHKNAPETFYADDN